MASYIRIRDIDWEDYKEDDEKVYNLYETIEEKDKEKVRKKGKKLRSYEGYVDIE